MPGRHRAIDPISLTAGWRRRPHSTAPIRFDVERLAGEDNPMMDLTPWQRALGLAEQSIGLSDPNPRVGCVITAADGRVIGEGFTQQAGGPHAEIMALRDVAARGESAQGACAWVTLEPCAHHGRTPPCCDALIAAGLAHVHVAIGDPFPEVAGRGIARLRAAGIDVKTDAPEAVSTAAFELNIGFFSRVLRGRPWVRLKAAVSLDGRTALPDGTSQWITGPAARADGHAWRKRAGAVLTGAGTVLDDDPRLDVRHVPTARQPLRVVVDSRLQTPPNARLLEPPGEVLIVHALDASTAEQQGRALRERGASLVAQPAPNDKVDLAALLTTLAAMGVNELHVEAGHRLNGSLIREGLVDELLVYMAPILMGDGRELAVLGNLSALAQAPRFAWHSVERVEGDLRILARVPGQPFLQWRHDDRFRS